MKTPFVLLGLGIVLQSFPEIGNAQVAQPPDAATRLVRTRRLVSVTESRIRQYRGDKPTGLIYYDDKGNMAVQIMPSRDRSKYAGPLPTPDEARDEVLGYAAYFGTWAAGLAVR